MVIRRSAHRFGKAFEDSVALLPNAVHPPSPLKLHPLPFVIAREVPTNWGRPLLADIALLGWSSIGSPLVQLGQAVLQLLDLGLDKL